MAREPKSNSSHPKVMVVVIQVPGAEKRLRQAYSAILRAAARDPKDGAPQEGKAGASSEEGSDNV